MLLACIRSYLKSFMRYKVFFLDTYHPDSAYLHEQGFEDPWSFFEAKRSPRANKVRETLLRAIAIVNSRGTCVRCQRFSSEAYKLCVAVFNNTYNLTV